MSERDPDEQAGGGETTGEGRGMNNTFDNTDSVSPLDLAKLAAMVDPAACRSGNSREALFNAAALLEESFAFCREMAKHEGIAKRSEWLTLETVSGSKGASNLFNAIAHPILSAPPAVLSLAVRDTEEDQLRAYLQKNATFEKWKTVRMVKDNLRAMFVDWANHRNKLNAVRIQERELLEQEEARRAGCTVEELPARARYQDTLWGNGEDDFQQLIERCVVKDASGRITRYDIPQSVADDMIQWKRAIRKTKGGIKAVRPLGRDDVLQKAVKEKIPKKRK